MAGGTIQADSITNSAGSGAPNFPFGATGLNPPNLNSPYAAAYKVISGTAYTSGTPINWDTQIFDPYSLVSPGSNWKWTAPFNCYLQIGGSIQVTGVQDMYVFLNGSSLTYLVSIGTITQNFYGIVKVPSGSYIDLRITANETITGSGISNLYLLIAGSY
jgi:hypothetical protein